MSIITEHRVHNREGYSFYKENYNTSSKYKAKTYLEWARIHKEIWKEVSKSIIESTSGVYIPRLGYIALVMMPYKCKIEKRGKVLYNDHSDNKWYGIVFFNQIVRNTPFKYWTIDRAFNQQVKNAIYRQIKKGKRYQLKFTLLKKLFLGKDTITIDTDKQRKNGNNR